MRLVLLSSDHPTRWCQSIKQFSAASNQAASSLTEGVARMFRVMGLRSQSPIDCGWGETRGWCLGTDVDGCSLHAAMDKHAPLSNKLLPRGLTISRQVVQKITSITAANAMWAKCGIARQLLPHWVCTTAETPDVIAVHLHANLRVFATATRATGDA